MLLAAGVLFYVGLLADLSERVAALTRLPRSWQSGEGRAGERGTLAALTAFLAVYREGTEPL